MIRRCVACLVLVMHLPVAAAGLDTAQLEQLAQDPQWLALLHIRRNMLGMLRSEVDEPSFFLSGLPVNALQELRATVAALSMPVAGEQNAWCLYPARATWLVEKKLVSKPLHLECRELQRWRTLFHTEKMVMVFPTLYMDNPASLFGHTFLRFDAADTTEHPELLSRALSYYADVASAGNTVSYILQGLAGGFDGVFEIRHYFEKIRKYSDNEDRDIWEYELDVSPDQIAHFIDHAWEVRGHSFHYFFLDENCSYRLIAMLDAVVPPYTMRLDFVTDAMPLDTVRVLHDYHFVRKAVYVPSAAKGFMQAVEALAPDERQSLNSFLAGERTVEALDQPAVIAAASDYAALQMRQDAEHRGRHALQLHTLMQQAAQFPATASEHTGHEQAATDFQARDPAQAGHGTRRLHAGWVTGEGADAVAVGARMAYHDWSDPLPGFERGTQLEVLDAEWRLYGNEADLDHVTWFSVQSRKPRNAYFQPVSWGIHFSRRREMLGDDFSLVHALDGERGVSYDCGGWLCYAELTASSIGGGAVDQGWALGAGGRAGALYQSDKWSLNIEAGQQRYLQGESHHHHYASLAWSYRLDRNLSWSAGYEIQDNGDNRREILSTGLRYFY